jgi:replicative DNA helicase
MKTDNELQAEFSVIGSLLIHNDSLDRIPDLEAEHFYNYENRSYFQEIQKQILAGKQCDVITVFDELRDKFPDCLPMLDKIANSTPSSANINRYSEMIIDKAIKRALKAILIEGEGLVSTAEKSGVCVDLIASKLDLLAQRKTEQEPKRFEDMMMGYANLLEDRLNDKIKPIATGFADLDEKLGGGLERGTLTVIAGRPASGKTAMGLAVARNTSFDGACLFLSMEMPKDQVCDRNVAALGHVPIKWLRKPKHVDYWDNVTKAFSQIKEMNLFIDDQPNLTMLSIRNKARKVKRKNSLDVLIIDQLSFITGAQSDKSYEAVGEYTRGLLAMAKELDIAVVLLCQLSRECEKRPNKRPMLSDLAVSGSIEQDANNILFLYRDEIYNPDSPDKGICEVIIGKQRQGETGMVGLAYIADQTRFEDLQRGWKPTEDKQYKRKGLAENL